MTEAMKRGPATKRAIRDVYPPDGAGDERMDDLIEQLRELNWPRSPGQPGDTEGTGDVRH